MPQFRQPGRFNANPLHYDLTMFANEVSEKNEPAKGSHAFDAVIKPGCGPFSLALIMQHLLC